MADQRQQRRVVQRSGKTQCGCDAVEAERGDVVLGSRMQGQQDWHGQVGQFGEDPLQRGGLVGVFGPVEGRQHEPGVPQPQLL